MCVKLFALPRDSRRSDVISYSFVFSFEWYGSMSLLYVQRVFLIAIDLSYIITVNESCLSI